MEDPIQDPQTVDAAPNQIPESTWNETVVPGGELSQYGSGLSAFGKPLQSPNFIEGQTGWHINSNGDAEFNNVRVRGVSNTATLPTYQPINGSSTPVAVTLTTTGEAVIADANDAALDDFFGFVTTNYTGSTTPAVFLNSTEATTSTTISHTLNAGADRIIMVHIQCGLVGSSTLPTSVTWNGIALTKLLGDGGGYTRWGLWYYLAGTSTTSTTADIVITGGTNQKAVFADNYQYVDQTNPFQDTDYVLGTSGTTVTNSYTTTQGYTLAVQYYADFLTGYNQTMALTLRHNDTSGDHNGCVSDGYLFGIKSGTLTSTTDYTGYDANNTGVGGLILFKNSKPTSIQVEMVGNVGGFSGLTPSADYYLSNTAGEISATPGSTSVLLGKAISTDTLLVINI